MAFFKFRFPGLHAAADAVAAGPNENLEVVRKRARHRLMGSVVLVLVAVVGFPLLFDTQPRPVAVDTPIVIPDRQSASPLTAQAPVTPAPTKPLAAHEGLGDKEEVVLPHSKPAVTAPATPPAAAPAVAPQAKAVIAPSMQPAKPKDKPVEKKPVESHAKPAADVKHAAETKHSDTKTASSAKPDKPAAKSKDDGGKARALLDGKSSSGERTVVQAGSFADPDKAREVRRKLEQAGLATYTQTLDGKDGKPTTRVRLGPYDSRDEAEKAAARVRKLGLSPSLLKI